MAVRLYLPKASGDGVERRRQVRMPAKVLFQTKAEITLTRLDQMRTWDVLHRCVVADADYRDNPNLGAARKAEVLPVTTDWFITLCSHRF